MPDVLRLLWIAESDRDAAAISKALGTPTTVQRVSTPAEASALAQDQDFELTLCSFDGPRAPLALTALPPTPPMRRAPLVLIADDYTDVALEAYRRGALVCVRGHLDQQLPAAVEQAMADAGAAVEERRKQAFELGQRELLEQMAAGAPRAILLEAVVRLIEEQADAMLCSILLLDRERRVVHHGAVSHLPREFIQAIDGKPIGPNAGSCGTAAYLGERVIVEDIATHDYWVKYRDHALGYGLRACWSSPIFAPDREVLGTFAMYYPTPRGPTPRELHWVDRATHLAAIVLVRDRDDRALRQRERMESLGTLAGGIAHDFNNILTTISGNARLASSDVPADHPIQESLREVQTATLRAVELVKQVMTFSRRNGGKREQLRLEAAVDEALRWIGPTLPTSIRLRTHYADDLPELIADPAELQQLVANLCVNAVDAMGEQGGALDVRISRRDARARWRAGATELRQGVYLKLEVSDTGAGIAPDALERIFDPFFTTKEQGRGIGLGLSVVHGMLQSHDGAIEVQSELGRGTTIRAYLPAVPPSNGKPQPAPRSGPARGEGEHVLCLDDEESVVRVTTQMLRRIGYRVTGQVDPLRALREIEADPAAFDVVLTDFAMPQLGGVELVSAIHAVRPALPIVVTSGRIEPDDIAALRAQGVREVLLKPSTLEELTLALRKALRGQL